MPLSIMTLTKTTHSIEATFRHCAWQLYRLPSVSFFYTYAECRFAECHFDDSRGAVVVKWQQGRTVSATALGPPMRTVTKFLPSIVNVLKIFMAVIYECVSRYRTVTKFLPFIANVLKLFTVVIYEPTLLQTSYHLSI